MQVRIRETNESEPIDDASLRSQVSSRGEGVKRMQAIVRNCRN